MIITNFKTYESATGESALRLAKIHQEVARETGADIQVAVQAVDLARISQELDIPVLAQHIDPVGFGGHTGHILPESVQTAGAAGTLLNHSERRLEREVLKASIQRAKELGLVTIVCAQDPEEGASFLEFDPDYIAVEPPELIGGDISVSTAQPEIIENAAKLIGSEKLLVGAGVKNGADVRLAIKLGAKGVLLASGVTKASDPKAVLMDLAGGLK
ncbi:triose-phosphate isomerase [Patescibacteria group bacterium]|nr:triose-phosphate isomerase [Patescibacteria group bacterium]MBU1016006.1 triose-phosphate isomerase [Patescibacteria group bacterium]MBU1684631.1 triose-phosphate isomerase [Patescibacteria group bacterium]MBU1939071.1 triose-phosphate isomerase [Patescibacteria group bacterium]